jgi:Arc/MetJ-type ribon-helix-helix transcriptional regulator
MTTLTTVSFKLAKRDLQRIPSRNRSEFIRAAVQEKLSRQKSGWKPKTALAKKLLALSEKFKGERLDAAGIAEEIRQRRGGLA